MANIIATKYVVVSKLYSLNDSIANKFEIVKAIQVVSVSLQGSIYDFLKLGMYPITSIAEIMITETSGLSNCHQIIIADKAVIKMAVSPLVIFLVPYLKENRKTPITKIVPTVRFSAPQPPPPYHIPTTAVPCVRAQISQV